MVERHLALIGLMGTGKSTIGRRCARELVANFIDTDALVEATSVMTIAEIFEACGEADFREREVVAVTDACAAPTRSVISCGGGAALDARNRTALRSHAVVIWLDADVGVLAERVGRTHHRPLLASGDPVATLTRLASIRGPSYEATAHSRIDTSTLNHDEATSAVLAAYRAFGEGDQDGR